MSKSPTHVVTGLIRFSYSNVFEARSMEDGQKPKFSTAILIDKKDKATLAKIEKAIQAAIGKGKEEKWKGKVPGNLKLPLRDGDEEKPDDPVYEGKMFLNASNYNKPGIVDENLNEILDKSEFYSGCYGRASINFYPYDNISKGVAAGLNNVQKLKDGEPLSGGTSAEEDFGEDFGDDLLS